LIESAHHRTAAFAGSASPWAPLGIRVFRMLWLASLVSNIGSWMHLVASAWLMTSLTASAALVALLQTANAGPSFVFALPAGALADVLDRRRLVVVTQAWQLVVAGALGVITLAHMTTPAVLLAMTFALAVGAALGSPAFSALTPELVPHDQLPSAVSLNSSSFTASQAVGPALGGLLVAAFGSGAVFLVNAGSFLAVVLVAAGWRRSRPARDLPAEHIAAAIRTGVRYVVNAPEFRSVLVRAAGYVICFSALPALLAVIARVRLHGTASAYGVLLGCIGIGGVAGTFVVPLLRARWSIDRLVTAGTLGYAVVLAGLSEVASLFGIATTLVAAGAALAASTLLGLRFQLRGAQAIDVALTDRPEPYVPVTLRPEDGPVQLTVEYRVASEDEEAFLEAVAELGRMRRRDGVLLWGLYSDPLVPDRHVESFISPSWTEHYRTSQRLTRDDRAILDRVRGFHRGEQPRLTALVGHDFSRHSSHRHVRGPMLARLRHEQATS
jgi:MFS family permease